VPDKSKALVTAACHAESQITAAYRDFPAHYGATVIPARLRKPKDKASVKGGVRICHDAHGGGTGSGLARGTAALGNGLCGKRAGA